MPFPFDLNSGLVAPQLVQPVINNDLTTPQGKQSTARLIDVTTKDYVVNDQGGFVGMDNVEQAVQLAIFTTFNSAVTPIGSTLRNIRVITSTINGIVQNSVQTCLANLINNKQIILGDVIVKSPGSSSVSLYIPFKNLVTGKDSNVTTRLGK